MEFADDAAVAPQFRMLRIMRSSQDSSIAIAAAFAPKTTHKTHININIFRN